MDDAEHLPVPDWFRAAVRAELKRRKQPQHELARAVGGVQSGVSALLKPGGIPKSKYVRPVCEVLDLPLPLVTAATELQARANQVMEQLRRANPKGFDVKVAAIISIIEADLGIGEDESE